GRVYRAIRGRVAETLTALQEGLAGVRVVQAFRREKRTLECYRPRSQAQVDAWRRASFVNIRLFAVLPLAQAAALISVLLVAASMYRNGSISIGTITAFVLYLIQLFDPIGPFTERLGALPHATPRRAQIAWLRAAREDRRTARGSERDRRVARGRRASGARPSGSRRRHVRVRQCTTRCPRRLARDRAGSKRRARRRDRCGQVDARQAPDAPVRP